MYNKKLCGHDFNEDCDCAAKGIGSFEMRQLINKTADLLTESSNIIEQISSLSGEKKVAEDPRYVSYVYTYTDIVLRGSRSFKLSCAISDIGLIGAAGAARTLFEIGINTLYIKNDKIQRLQQFMANATGTFEKGVTFYWKYREKQDAEIPEIYQKSKEGLEKLKQTYGDPRLSNRWSGRGVGGRADDIGIKKIYDYVYPLLSSITHASSIQMSAYSDMGKNVTSDNIVKLHNAPDIFSNHFFFHSAWMVVLWSVDIMMSEFIRVFEIPYRDTMEYRKIRSFTNKVVEEYFELCELCSEKSS